MNLRARYLNKTFTGVPFSLLNTTILAGKFQLLLDKFAGAAAAYSLRALSKDSTNVVKVRRDSDNAERDFTATEVSDGTLEAWTKGTLSTTAPADYGSGAAAAYSLRVVSDSYTGPVVKVRRSDDNAEADFTAEEVSDGTLLAWVGTTASDDGFVTTWYDQSGNSNDATQATAANQPKIVDAGVLVTDNGFPAILCQGNQLLQADRFVSNLNALSLFFVAKNEAGSGLGGVFANLGDVGNNTRLAFFFVEGNGVFRVQYGDSFDEIETAYDSNRNFHSIIAGSTNNNLSYKINSGSAITRPLQTGSINTSTSFNLVSGDVILTEAIGYNSDQSANRADIEGDINDYYGIYTPTTNGFVTTWYDQSGNSNDATQATAASQPKIVDAGVLVTENGKAALDFDGVDDYFSFTPFTTSIYSSIAVIAKATTANNFATLGVSQGDGQSIGAWANDLFYENNGSSFVYVPYTNNTSKNLFTVIKNGNAISDFSGWQNGSGLGAYSGNAFTNISYETIGVRLGNTGSDTFSNGTISELILYPSDQSANRVLIERNIASYYGITLA